MKEPYIITNKYGRFSIDKEDEVSKTLAYGNLWEQDLINFVTPYLCKDKVVIEVGSYIGDHTVYLAQHSKFVYAFEGNIDNYTKLLYNLELNGIANVSAYNKIIGYGVEIIKPADDTDEFKNDYINNPSGNRYVEDSNGEQSARLDDLLDFIDNPVSLLKIDCEGMDYDVMFGALNIIHKFSPIIAYEYNWYISKKKPEDFDVILRQLGYKPSVRIDTWNWVCTK